MKIKAEKLVNFLERISLKGRINTCVLDFREDGITTNVMAANIVSVSGQLGKQHFDDYEAIGEIGIKNNMLLVSMLKRYGDSVVKIEQQENKLVIVSSTGSTFYVLCDKKNVDDYIEKPHNIMDKFDNLFELEVEKLTSIKHAADTIKAEQLLLEIKNNNLKLVVESEIGDKITEETEVEYADTVCKYGHYLMSVINVITGKVNIGVKEKYPILIICGDFKYIVAPLISEDD